MVIDFRRAGKHYHKSLTIGGATVERVSSIKFLGVQLADGMTLKIYSSDIVKTAQQLLHPLLD